MSPIPRRSRRRSLRSISAASRSWPAAMAQTSTTSPPSLRSRRQSPARRSNRPSRAATPLRSRNSCSLRARPACPRASSTPMACSPPTSSRSCRSGRSSPRNRRCWWTGCRGTTFGGNHNFNLVMRNAGTLFIDAGKPVPALIGRPCATSPRYRRPSISTCRPAMPRCCRTMESDAALARRFFGCGSCSTPAPCCPRICGCGSKPPRCAPPANASR